jgi:general stress protein YciG
MVVEKKKRGFACMSREQRSAIASLGGKAAQSTGSAHRWSPETAAEAGRKGGMIAHAIGRAHKWNSRTAAEAGRKGGQAKHDKSKYANVAH